MTKFITFACLLCLVLICGCSNIPNDARWEELTFRGFFAGVNLPIDGREPDTNKRYILIATTGETLYCTDDV